MIDIDITPVFFNFVHNISFMEYNDLVKTKIFNDFIFYVNNEMNFILYIENKRIYFEDINSLFYGTLEYCTQYGIPTDLLKIAIKKMELVVEIDNLSDIFESNL